VIEAVGKLNQVKGVKGMRRFFKQIAQSARQGWTSKPLIKKHSVSYAAFFRADY
jgi:hypothetical protein